MKDKELSLKIWQCSECRKITYGFWEILRCTWCGRVSTLRLTDELKTTKFKFRKRKI